MRDFMQYLRNRNVSPTRSRLRTTKWRVFIPVEGLAKAVRRAERDVSMIAIARFSASFKAAHIGKSSARKLSASRTFARFARRISPWTTTRRRWCPPQAAQTIPGPLTVRKRNRCRKRFMLPWRPDRAILELFYAVRLR